MPATHHLAQMNIGRLRAPLDDPTMADFVDALPVINGLADAAPGFVWRLLEENNSAGADPRRPHTETVAHKDVGDVNVVMLGTDVIVNLSVWESVETLRAFTYHTAHLESLRRRREFFDHAGLPAYLVLWWVPTGHLPTVAEGQRRLDLLATDGPGPDAFTFRRTYPPPSVPAPAPDEYEPRPKLRSPTR